jgi:hypothetical protein
MVRLNRKQRTAMSDTLRQFANIVAAAFVVGQFVAARPLSWSLFFAGAVVWVVLAGGGVLLLAGEDQ